ncbi:DUF6311 domain-containing protein [Lonsdalea quercina]|uniref:DUF6311 domain-containing protein n=1 Tax=Lonsdalea quercina TaxID=71657 RepID=UPI003976566F
MRNWSLTLIAGFIGIIAFAFLGGLSIFNPTNVSYLLDGDAAQHLIGWNFFRNTPFLQWPIGNNTAYGMELNNSIVYTDSIPLFAIFFKILSPLLPSTFQYTGIWLASCFILQSIMGFILIKRFTENNFYSLISTIFFVLSSSMLVRVGGHFALSAHWLILAGMILFFNKKPKNNIWILIISISALVHAYILAMVLSMWIANLINKILIERKITRSHIFHIILTISFLLFLMYAVGYFNISGGTESDGFGFYKINLNSIFNPLFPSFSSIITPMPSGGGDYEGLNYLGAGIITMAVISLLRIPLNRKAIDGLYKRNVTFIVFCILLTIFSLSCNIDLGSENIVHLKYPEYFDGFTSTFRSSGRFFWTVFYTIIAVVLVINFRVFDKKTAIFIAIICAAVQLYDAKALFPEMKYKYTLKYSIPQPSSAISSGILQGKKYLIAVPPESFNPEWKEWAYFVSTHDMHMNFGYFARYSKELWEKQSSELYEKINSGKLNNESVYMFKDRILFEKALSNYKKKSNTLKDGENYFITPE